MRESGSATREAVERLFAEHELTVKVRMSLGSNEAIKQAIAGGLGLSVLSRHTLALMGATTEITELDADSIEDGSHLVMDLGADSMAALELMAALEKRYAIVIDPECLPEMHSLGSITALVGRVQGASGA